MSQRKSARYMAIERNTITFLSGAPLHEPAERRYLSQRSTAIQEPAEYRYRGQRNAAKRISGTLQRCA